MHSTHDRAIAAFRILNDLVGDLIAATRAPELFLRLPKIEERVMRIVVRMCFAYIILTLAKYIEFYERFRSLIPRECIDACKKLHNELLDRRVLDFRNKGVGHIWDNASDRPLTTKELDELVATVTGGDTDAFIKWINNQADNSFPKTIVGIVEGTRAAIRAEHKLTEEEIFPKP